MERRKVQRTGGSTYIVSLPKKWVDANGIGQGDAVDVDADLRGPVTIYPVGTRPTATRTLHIVVDPDRATSHAERRVIGAYLAGYETIIVEGQGRFPAEHKQAMRALSQTLIGIEIVEETQRQIVLQDLLDPTDFDLTKAIDRMHKLAHAMVEDALQALAEGDDDLARDVGLRDPEVDRLDWMIVKQFHLVSSNSRLASQLRLGPSQALHHLLASHALERIADHASRLGEICCDKGAHQLPKATREALAAYGQVVLGALDAAFAAFLKSDFNAANDALTKCRDIQANASELLGRGKGQTAAAQVDLALLVKSIERVRSYTMDIAEAAIDHHMIQLGQSD